MKNFTLTKVYIVGHNSTFRGARKYILSGTRNAYI